MRGCAFGDLVAFWPDRAPADGRILYLVPDVKLGFVAISKSTIDSGIGFDYNLCP